jgi:hypothetical protein
MKDEEKELKQLFKRQLFKRHIINHRALQVYGGVLGYTKDDFLQLIKEFH